MVNHAIGDVVWIRLIGVQGLHQGTIVAVLRDDSVTHPFFIIHLDNHAWPHYEVRDATLIGTSKDALLPMQGSFQGGRN